MIPIKNVIIFIILVFIFGTLIFITSNNKSNIEYIKNDLSAIAKNIDSGTSDRYRGADARKDFEIVNNRIERNEGRISKLEDILSRVSS